MPDLFSHSFQSQEPVVITDTCIRAMEKDGDLSDPHFALFLAKARAFVDLPGVVEVVNGSYEDIDIVIGHRHFYRMRGSWLRPIHTVFCQLDIGDRFMIAPNGPTIYTKTGEESAASAYTGATCSFNHGSLEVIRATKPYTQIPRPGTPQT